MACWVSPVQIQPKSDCKPNSAGPRLWRAQHPILEQQEEGQAFEEPGTAPGKAQTCSSSSAGWLAQAKAGWRDFRYAPHLQEVCTSFPQLVTNQASHRRPPRAGGAASSLLCHATGRSRGISKSPVLPECPHLNRSNQQFRHGCLLHLATSVYRQNQYASVSLTNNMLINCGRKSALGSKTTCNCHRQVLQNSQFVCDSNKKLLLLCLHSLSSVSAPVIINIPSPDSRNSTLIPSRRWVCWCNNWSVHILTDCLLSFKGGRL